MPEGVGGTRFTISQVLQFVGLVLAGALAWGNLKTEVREGFARMEGRLYVLDYRVEKLEHVRPRPATRTPQTEKAPDVSPNDPGAVPHP
jgi:hypothetical protein